MVNSKSFIEAITSSHGLDGVPALLDRQGKIKVHLDSNKVPGWNEIDAIGLISGSRTQWAVAASASTSYSEIYQKNDQK